MSRRHAFIVSDQTGLTAEALGHSLLSQFPTIKFQTEILMYVDTREKMQSLVEKINGIVETTGQRPLVFITVVDDGLREMLYQCKAACFDMFGTFISPMEKELQVESSHSIGKSHGVSDVKQYTSRIAAVHYSMTTDDGMELEHYDKADIIIVGVSRSGKTPTSLYLSLHYGIFAANYPLTLKELESKKLPMSLIKHRKKLFGLTIDPFRLQQIRGERYSAESYASAKICQLEVAQAENIYRVAQIPYINTTKVSIEEIGARIMHQSGIKRVLF